MKFLVVCMQEVSFIDYDTEEEEEKWRVVSERLTPLPDDFDNLSTGRLLLRVELGRIFFIFFNYHMRVNQSV